MPQMFADSPAAPLSVVDGPRSGVVSNFPGFTIETDVPLAGGARRMKVAANNRALPQDRILFEHQLFREALTADGSRLLVDPVSTTIDLIKYTIGFEKTFADEQASIDVRIPFTNQFELASQYFGVEAGRIGNINAKTEGCIVI